MNGDLDELEGLAKAATPAKGHDAIVDGCADCRVILRAQRELGRHGHDVLALIERVRTLEQPAGYEQWRAEMESERARGDACAQRLQGTLEREAAERKGTSPLTLEQLRDCADLAFCPGCGIDLQGEALIADFLACSHDPTCWLAAAIKEASA